LGWFSHPHWAFEGGRTTPIWPWGWPTTPQMAKATPKLFFYLIKYNFLKKINYMASQVVNGIDMAFCKILDEI
jgi:hypothetical protein